MCVAYRISDISETNIIKLHLQHIKPTDSIKIQQYNPGYPPEHSPGVIFWNRPTTSL